MESTGDLESAGDMGELTIGAAPAAGGPDNVACAVADAVTV
ncbi:hypothetical protein ABZ349_05625 [Streptomyces niveus]